MVIVAVFISPSVNRNAWEIVSFALASSSIPNRSSFINRCTASSRKLVNLLFNSVWIVDNLIRN